MNIKSWRWKQISRDQTGEIAFAGQYLWLREIFGMLLPSPRLGESLGALVASAGIEYGNGYFWKDDEQIQDLQAWSKLRRAAMSRSNAYSLDDRLVLSINGVAVRIRKGHDFGWHVVVIILKRDWLTWGTPAMASQVAKFMLCETSLDLRCGSVMAASPDMPDESGDLVIIGNTIRWAFLRSAPTEGMTWKQRQEKYGERA
jgi:hypothetical protein